MGRKTMRTVAGLLAASISLSAAGCGTAQYSSFSEEKNHSSTSISERYDSKAENEGIIEAENPLTESDIDNGMTEQQKNSFSMLYYLAITAEKIRISKDNRLILDDIYSSLLNDINPGAIDETTQEHLKNLRDIIKSYLDISVKRERLQYIYNQDKAEAIRNAVPKPLAVLSVVSSFDWKKLAASVAYTVVDSYNNYKLAESSADREFLLSGWELDDEETAAIRKNRERAFDYMVDIVQEYDLDGKLTLNEKAIESFAEICAIESIPQKLRRLESEFGTYRLLGNYWLELAECYYETEQYEKCLECIDRYNQLSIGIYRKDSNYVKILPKAIVAAQECCKGNTYLSKIKNYADAIIANTDTDEWSTRYFAAQTYLELYAKTNDKEFLSSAYNIALDNVTVLLKEQRKLNEVYLQDVKETVIQEPDYSFLTEDEKKQAKAEYKEEQKRLRAYNKALRENRKTELPPLYEPLVLNCDMLFALAGKMKISGAEKKNIEEILQTHNKGTFISDPVNYRYSFSEIPDDYSLELGVDEILVPVNLLSTDGELVVSVTDKNNSEVFDDFVVKEVERKGSTMDLFFARMSSEKMKKYQWTDSSELTVKIFNRDENDPFILKYRVSEIQERKLLPDKVVFDRL